MIVSINYIEEKELVEEIMKCAAPGIHSGYEDYIDNYPDILNILRDESEEDYDDDDFSETIHSFLSKITKADIFVSFENSGIPTGYLMNRLFHVNNEKIDLKLLEQIVLFEIDNTLFIDKPKQSEISLFLLQTLKKSLVQIESQIQPYDKVQISLFRHSLLSNFNVEFTKISVAHYVHTNLDLESETVYVEIPNTNTSKLANIKTLNEQFWKIPIEYESETRKPEIEHNVPEHDILSTEPKPKQTEGPAYMVAIIFRYFLDHKKVFKQKQRRPIAELVSELTAIKSSTIYQKYLTKEKGIAVDKPELIKEYLSDIFNGIPKTRKSNNKLDQNVESNVIAKTLEILANQKFLNIPLEEAVMKTSMKCKHEIPYPIPEVDENNIGDFYSKLFIDFKVRK